MSPQPWSPGRAIPSFPIRQLACLCLACLNLTSGCGRTPPAKPVEHSIPQHWPADLIDASRKLERFAAAIDAAQAQGGPAQDQGGQSMVLDDFRRLQDVVGWAPEIAADSPLAESDWVPIHESSEMLSAKLRGMAWDTGTKAAIEAFRNLLIEKGELITPKDDPTDTGGVDANPSDAR